MNQFLFRLGGGTGRVEEIFEGAAFESEGGKAEDFGKALVVDRLHDDPDTARETKFMSHDVGPAHGGVVTPGCTNGVEIDDDGFVWANESEFVIEIVAGGDFTSRAVDMKENGGDGIVIGRLANLKDEIIDHAGANLTGDFLSDHPEEIDFGDATFLRIVPLDQLLFKVRCGLDTGGVGEQMMILRKEEEIGEEAASEQYQSHDEKEFRATKHAGGKNASD